MIDIKQLLQQMDGIQNIKTITYIYPYKNCINKRANRDESNDIIFISIRLTWFISKSRISMSRVFLPSFLPYYFNMRFLS
jgi:hypothetical protein